MLYATSYTALSVKIFLIPKILTFVGLVTTIADVITGLVCVNEALGDLPTGNNRLGATTNIAFDKADDA